jgi:hypothetical protein
MVRGAGSHTSRPVRAAYVNVETSAKPEWAELPDLDRPFLGTEKD